MATSYQAEHYSLQHRVSRGFGEPVYRLAQWIYHIGFPDLNNRILRLDRWVNVGMLKVQTTAETFDEYHDEGARF
jgi:hypothetical protein